CRPAPGRDDNVTCRHGREERHRPESGNTTDVTSGNVPTHETDNAPRGVIGRASTRHHVGYQRCQPDASALEPDLHSPLPWTGQLAARVKTRPTWIRGGVQSPSALRS